MPTECPHCGYVPPIVYNFACRKFIRDHLSFSDECAKAKIHENFQYRSIPKGLVIVLSEANIRDLSELIGNNQDQYEGDPRGTHYTTEPTNHEFTIWEHEKDKAKKKKNKNFNFAVREEPSEGTRNKWKIYRFASSF